MKRDHCLVQHQVEVCWIDKVVKDILHKATANSHASHCNNGHGVLLYSRIRSFILAVAEVGHRLCEFEAAPIGEERFAEPPVKLPNKGMRPKLAESRSSTKIVSEDMDIAIPKP